MPLQYRRNWKERWFVMDLADSVLRYYMDESREVFAGEVRFLPGKTRVNVPKEVVFTGKHAPKPGQSIDYMELTGTADAAGQLRAFPFALRANSPLEFEDWRRTFNYAIKSQGLAGIPPTEDQNLETVEDFYYQSSEDESIGPLNLAGLRRAYQSQIINFHSHVYSDTLGGNWRTIGTLPSLLDSLKEEEEPTETNASTTETTTTTEVSSIPTTTTSSSDKKSSQNFLGSFWQTTPS